MCTIKAKKAHKNSSDSCFCYCCYLLFIYFFFFELVDYWTVFSGGKLCRSKNLIIQVHTILNDFFSLIMAVNISHSVIRSSIHPSIRPSIHSSIKRQESPNNSREINWLNHLHYHSSLEKIDRSSLRLGGWCFFTSSILYFAFFGLALRWISKRFIRLHFPQEMPFSYGMVH